VAIADIGSDADNRAKTAVWNSAGIMEMFWNHGLVWGVLWDAKMLGLSEPKKKERKKRSFLKQEIAGRIEGQWKEKGERGKKKKKKLET
jgi:hypothetical protein